MKLTKSGPLTDREIDWLEEILMKYGMDDSVLCFSELDGLLTAILSGPNMVSPNKQVDRKTLGLPQLIPRILLRY
ncbi:UPF0149 family protein [Escherichia coli]|nr:UPF0149 family protein [Escherichia coli]MDF7563596.1 UPF0149 family protein [Escherichia coli]MDN7363897.1 UPF0149 family protein [Escherichia coli]